jgi:diacylglycerol kinase family enzyme
MGPTAAFASGTLRTIARYRPPEIAIRVDDVLVHEGPISLVVAANGCFFGAGMRIAPGAVLDDGAFEVVVVEALSKVRLVANFPSIYRGAHLAHPAVHHYRGGRVSLEVLSGEGLLDVDGEPLGVLPAEIELLPKALGLFGLPPVSREAPAGT